MIKYIHFFALLLLIILLSCENLSGIGKIHELNLEKAYFVEGFPGIQPSGLTIWNNKLITVSDKHDSIIFEIEINDYKAIFKPFIYFTLPKNRLIDKMDFEGITCDRDGNFYLVSETNFQILKVNQVDKTAKWIGSNLKSFGVKSGLFQLENAYLEGISINVPNKFILCAERQPRGILELDLDNKKYQIDVYKIDKTKFPMRNTRPLDFSGLFKFNNSIYALHKNADLICELDDKNEYREIQAWSFEKILEHKEFRYFNNQYGLAEGLAIDNNYIYVILDNNNNHRVLYPEDRRPLLLIMKRQKN